MKKLIIIIFLTSVNCLAFAQEPVGNDSTQKANDKVYVVVESQAQFPGGRTALFEFLAENVKYPEAARRKGIQGPVFTSFIVEKDGSITDIKVEKSLHPDCDSEAVRVISLMPRWKPAMHFGEVVRYRATCPVRFK